MNRFLVFLVGAFACAVPRARADWPEFRGTKGDGSAPVGGGVTSKLPVHWGEQENVKWKTAIPERGWSTPVVMGNQIWLTTASVNGHDFFAICVDAVTGKIVFNEQVFHCVNPESLGNDMNCYASPSPTIEPGRVYVNFGSYGTACLDTKTFKVLWKRDDLPCRHYRGPGSSVILFRNLLILTMDGVDVQYLAALDKSSGKTVWKTDRTAEWNDLGPDGKPIAEGDRRKAYSTPLIVDVAGEPQMITAAAKAAYGYDPRDGRELWKVRHEGFSVATRPVYGDGLAFISSGSGRAEMMAIRVEGRGDITDTHVAWHATRGVPRLVSPILVDGLLFMISDGGIGICRDAATGEECWQERVGGAYASSPLYANGLIYAFNQAGQATVYRASRAFEVVARNKLDDGFMASPAVFEDSLILRTRSHLYRIQAE